MWDLKQSNLHIHTYWIIKKVTSFKFNQVYEVARELKANKIVYHNGYIPKTYMNVEWIKNVAKFWNEFLEDKKDLHVVVENVLEQDYYIIDSLKLVTFFIIQ